MTVKNLTVETLTYEENADVPTSKPEYLEMLVGDKNGNYIKRLLSDILKDIDVMQSLVPIGTVTYSAMKTAQITNLRPVELQQYYMIAHGQQLLKTAYPDLYTVIGGTYGETATHFRLPDLQNKFVRAATPHGDTAGTLIESDSEGNFTIPSHIPGTTENYSTNPRMTKVQDHKHFCAVNTHVAWTAGELLV